MVPIHHELPFAALKELHGSLNGVIFPGGNSDATYHSAISLLLNLTLASYSNADPSGNRCALLAICLGFEQMVQLSAANKSVEHGGFDSLLYPHTLEVTAKSRIFAGLPDDLRQLMASTNVSMHNHGGGVDPESFLSDPQLAARFEVTSIALDRKKQRMANIIEGKSGMPIYGLIWHPEMPPFDDFSDVIPHQQAAVKVSQWVADFFVEEARTQGYNRRFPSDKAEEQALIWHDAPQLIDALGNGSEVTEVYLFERKSSGRAGASRTLGRELPQG